MVMIGQAPIASIDEFLVKSLCLIALRAAFYEIEIMSLY